MQNLFARFSPLGLDIPSVSSSLVQDHPTVIILLLPLTCPFYVTGSSPPLVIIFSRLLAPIDINPLYHLVI